MPGPRAILHLIDTGGPGGAETVYLDIASGLDPAHWSSRVVLPERDWLWREAERRGFAPVLLPADRSFDAGYLVRLARLAARERAQLIQTHLLGSAVYGAMIARFRRIPLVATFHGTVDVQPDDRRLGIKRRLIDCGRHRVVFVSEALRASFGGADPERRARCHVIPNGIDLSRYHPGRDPQVRRELGAASDHFLVGAVGNLRPAKSYDVLLRAAAALGRDAPGVRFAIVGEGHGKLREDLLALRSELALEETVTFHGFRDDAERVFRALDAYVVSSSSEGFSLTTVQAMASGVPVVSTRCGGPEEILAEGGGLLVARGVPTEIAGAIERLRRDHDLRARIGREGVEIARSRFDRARMARDYGDLYASCLARRGGVR